MKIKEIIAKIEDIIPSALSNEFVKTYDSFDNEGLNIGNDDNDTCRILCCLDVTNKIVDEAISKKIGLIICHHPLIYNGIYNINNYSILGKKIIKLLKNDIAVYSRHLSLDAVADGVNGTLSDALGSGNFIKMIFPISNGNGIGGIKELHNKIKFSKLTEKLAAVCSYDKVRDYGEDKEIKRIAYCGGNPDLSYAMVDTLFADGVECIVSSEFKNHIILYAIDKGINLIDLGHYNSEVVVVDKLIKKIQSLFNDVEVQKSVNLELR